ncbi:DUF1330 domain-containing protein [Billgrantia sulfidoxydans]|uniref:DUF1330 domain-containing protein n=1 Tax=Billgrantia sulfidoxydans TaxID=2733484 RepID=A0ABX7W2F2_9GAMM|nr:DUF1330 domain-containing protein [Halomonas sulfidoxydans]QTP53837.1 DUF1330 domain-containing protein [Halomonas sulfidoxydans]
MTAYAIARLQDVTMGPEIVEYLEKIDATLAPYGGRYLIHGGPTEVLEGNWQGDTIMLGFPGLEQARAWYRSEAYRRILPLRTANAVGDVILVEGVEEGHRGVDILG